MLHQGAFIDKRHELVLHPVLKPGYLGGVTMEPLDGGRALLTVSAVLLSSVYTQVAQLQQMLGSICDPFEEGAEPAKLVGALTVVLNADPPDVVKFLPLLLTHLFRLVCTSAGGPAFVLLSSLIMRLLDDAESATVLMAFAEHTFMTPKFHVPQ